MSLLTSGLSARVKGFLNRKPLVLLPFYPSLVSPEWRGFWESALGVWPMWEKAGLQVNDLSSHRNHGAYTVVGGDGGFATGPNGSITTYLGSDDFVDTGVEEINGIGVFADSSERWTVAVRYRIAPGTNGTIVARAASGNRTFQIGNTGVSNEDPFIWVRGSITRTNWHLDDGNFHTVFVSWDGSTAIGSYDGNKEETTLSVGAAAENTGERIIFGARTNGTGFFCEDAAIDFVYIFDFALNETQKIDLVSDFYGPFRTRSLPLFIPSVAPIPPGSLALTGVGI